jgi:putative redox protein
MAKTGTAHARLIGPMRFDVESGSGHTITLDVSREGGGEDSGPTPMELMVMGLAGCTGMDVISILHKQRQDVTGYEIFVHGTRADQHPQVFTEITVEHVVTGRGIKPQFVQRAVELSETTYCSVSAMLSKTARITTTYRTVEA